MQPIFTARLYSHHVTIVDIVPRAHIWLRGFLEGFYHRVFRKVPNKPPIQIQGKLYAAVIANGGYYHLHREQWPLLQDYLKRNNIGSEQYAVEEVSLYSPVAIDVAVRPEWTPRDHQWPILEHTRVTTPPATRLVEVRPGDGKTFTSLWTMAERGERFLVGLKPKYIDQWLGEIPKILSISRDKIRVIQGNKALRAVLQEALDGSLTESCFIVSLDTFRAYLDMFEEFGPNIDALGFPVIPPRFHETLGIGSVILDEVHEDFHLMWRYFLYAHVPLIIGLSASLLHSDRFLMKMYQIAFPKGDRYKREDDTPYIEAYAVRYRLANPKAVRTTEYGSTFYSHMAFEKSLQKNRKLLHDYLKLIRYVVKLGFLDRYAPGDKLAVYASTIEMCSIITQDLQAFCPGLDVRRGTGQDAFSNLTDADIRVATPKRAGTGIDMPGLTTVIMTVNVYSFQINFQLPGRLRELKHKGVKFYYLYSESLPKHVNYHLAKKKLTRGYVKNLHEIGYSEILGGP